MSTNQPNLIQRFWLSITVMIFAIVTVGIAPITTDRISLDLTSGSALQAEEQEIAFYMTNECFTGGNSGNGCGI